MEFAEIHCSLSLSPLFFLWACGWGNRGLRGHSICNCCEDYEPFLLKYKTKIVLIVIMPMHSITFGHNVQVVHMMHILQLLLLRDMLGHLRHVLVPFFINFLNKDISFPLYFILKYLFKLCY